MMRNQWCQKMIMRNQWYQKSMMSEDNDVSIWGCQEIMMSEIDDRR
jgi:hypothetical protein